MIKKVAIVTGANGGLGYGIVKGLCKRGVKKVYLTARDEKRGLIAVDKLKRENYSTVFHQLDITDEVSVRKFADYIRIQKISIDILVNNAAVICKNLTVIDYEDAKRVINVNFYGVLNLEKYLYCFLNNDARVINICSDTGHLSQLKNKFWVEKLSKEDLTLSDIEEFIMWFLNSVKNNTLRIEDFSWKFYLPYAISKMALCAYTRVQQRHIGRGISINSLHPGFVKTPMTKGTGMLSPEEASDAPIFLALDADQSVKGKYIWFDKSQKDWANTSLVFDYVDLNAFTEFLNKMNNRK
ncbi:unnamed protein product [Pieris macdunnoughi]|uniref:Uncharacterized protein n=1 Tax=Pieris macdunnoughi TaxID=345717 RepID=A0A821Y4F6_9NEOP|nr:unnamed protein product [Pieris macdunnoughi]